MSISKKLKLLVMIYLSLLGLLALSWIEYRFQVLPASMAIAICIAFAKAILIAWFFMELKNDPTLIRWTCLAALFWMALLFGLTALDFGFRT